MLFPKQGNQKNAPQPHALIFQHQNAEVVAEFPDLNNRNDDNLCRIVGIHGRRLESISPIKYLDTEDG